LKLAFIVQRCGEDILGGAESLCLNIAKRLAKDFDIEILTTCAKDYMSWKNEYKAGISHINDVPVRRFKVDFERNVKQFNQTSQKIFNENYSLEEEREWMKQQGPFSTEMIEFIKKNKDDYELFVFFTYLYGTTYYGIKEVFNKSVLVPQAHDEPPLKLGIFDDVFEKTKGIIFQTEEEQTLVQSRFNLSGIQQKLIGQGVDFLLPSNESSNDEPFILYVGRIDKSKGCDQLIEFFEKFKSQNPSNLKLYLAGTKMFDFESTSNIKYLGKISDQQKSNLLGRCTTFVMPSRFESFSIAIMEAWLAKKPVIVNGHSEVLKGHCEKSNGGLYYKSYEDFEKTLKLILSDEKLRGQMGINGQTYVKRHYDWNNIIIEYGKFFKKITETKSNKNILTFVIPWYGKDLNTGAEKQCRRTAENLKQNGFEVEVFATCSKEFQSDWSNYYKEGKNVENNVMVHRFPVDKRDIEIFDSINYKLMNNISISSDEEITYIKNSINSSKLIDAIKEQKENRIYIFIPYLHGVTYFGCKECPEKSILIPCFHDESYAYMEIFKQVLPKVQTMFFNSEPERKLAQKIYKKLPSYFVTGEGVDSDFKPNPENFKTKFHLNRFLLYAGRKDTTKNVPLLIDYYIKYVEKNGVKFDLVITGPGEIEIPKKYCDSIKSLFLSLEDLHNAYSAALVTCQPSLNESFSLAIMESWLCSTPVLVHENCDVTKDHCIQSNGGLYFSSYDEFERCMNYFLEHEEERKLMAINGKNYVLDNFDWKKIIKKYSDFINNLFG